MNTQIIHRFVSNCSKVILLSLFLWFPKFSFTQNEANIWYFGYNAGLDFNSGAPVALTNGQLRTDEGCSSVSDNAGNLLFYTDGVKVYNKKHQIMPNGNGLLGNFSSTQSSIVVPQPGSNSLYYIFTVDATAGNNGLHYSIVDMRKNNGNGDIITKNVSLYTPSSEKITAVMHANTKDFWIISHKFRSTDFVTYKLTSTGLSSTNVVSSVGTIHDGLGENARGYMKVSPDGTRLALACDAAGFIEVFDFDNSTGKITNPIKLNYYKPYGLEFSPNNRFLYVGSWGSPGFIVQLDLSQTNSANMKASEVEIAKGTHSYAINALQLGPDGKIYVSVYKTYLDVISDPNRKGSACKYINKFVDLDGKQGVFGLPTYIQSFFNVPLVDYTNVCYKDFTSFELTHNQFDSIHWDFGDVKSGSKNFSNLSAPKHQYTDSGSYRVRTIVFKGILSDTSYLNLKIYRPRFSLGNDTTLCPGELLNLQVNSNSITWQDNSQANTFQVNSKGLYWAEITEGPCLFRDSIRVDYVDLKPLDLKFDTLRLCKGVSFFFDVQVDNAIYLWHDGSTESKKYVDDAGDYWVIRNTQGCIQKDSLFVIILPLPSFSLGRDTAVCKGDMFKLEVKLDVDEHVSWSTLEESNSIQISKTGWYWAYLDSGTCGSKDSIYVEVLDIPDLNLGEYIRKCEGDSFTIDLGKTAQSYVWQDNSTSSKITISESAELKVTARSGKCSVRDSVFVEFIDCQCFVYVPTAFTPQGDLLNDGYKPSIVCPISEYVFRVLNRWGELVYESKDENASWDGNFEGKPANQDIYVYQLQFRYFLDGKMKHYKGTLHLLR
ncbi:MAG: gliding motility-associated C-terminal domain-containing protein [Bacteroidia bacterium]